MKADNDLYRQLRELPAAQLWTVEVPKFDQLGPKERNQQVALVRAVGVVFSTSRNPEMKAAVKAWMIGLLQDPSKRSVAMPPPPSRSSGATKSPSAN